MLLYKFSLRLAYSSDVVIESMINELGIVGRESLNGRMLTGKGQQLPHLWPGQATCTLMLHKQRLSMCRRVAGKEVSDAARSYFIPIVVKHWQVSDELNRSDKTTPMARDDVM